MKLIFTSLILLFSFYLHFGGNLLFAEGTKQLNPTAADPGSIQIYAQNGSGATFATFNGPVNQRLNLRICNVGEKVYFGFSSKDNFQMRVVDPNGNIVSNAQDSAGTSIAFPKNLNTQPGLIANYNEAVNGPSDLVGTSGYNSISFTANLTGDYSIEFNRTNANATSTIDMFDITVADSNGAIKTGRLWSSAWMINTYNYSNPFNATMYVYTKDNITTKVDFNGIQPYEFVISSNSTGTAKTGNPIQDRKSVRGNFTYPEYKLFLNDPDSSCYPTGFLGEIVGDASITGCPDNYCINIEVTAPGNMIFIIEANGIPGFQNGTKDRQIQADIKKGKNCVKWDGKDGDGNQIGSSTTVDLSIQYVNGLTHLPIFDVENHTNGYHVEYVRPRPTLSSSEITLFWDDSNINSGQAPDGKINSTSGCFLSSGCHKWTNRGDNNNCVRTGVCSETINTWWYVKESDASIIYNYKQYTIDANTKTIGNGELNDTSVCSSTKQIKLNGGLTGDSLSKWSILKGSGTFANVDSLKTTYTLSKNDQTIDVLILQISNINCPVIHDTIKINLEKLPVLTMPAPFSICSNNTTLSTNANIANVGGIRWAAGEGKFSDSLNTSIKYTPSQAEIDSSFVKLFAFTTPKSGQLCPMLNDSVKISVFQPATLQAPSDTIVCQPSTFINLVLKANSIGSDSVVWLSNGVIPVPRKGLSSTFSLTNGNAFSVFLTAFKKGCNPIKDTVKVKFEAQPIIIASQTDTCSSDLRIKLSGSSLLGSAKGTATWTSSGTGLFLLNKDSLSNNAYIPSKLDSTLGQVSLKLASKGQVFCPVKDTSFVYKIIPLPKASVGNDSLVCINSLINLTTNQNSDWKYEWRKIKSGAISSATNKLSFIASLDTNRVYLKVSNSRNCLAFDSSIFATITPPAVTVSPSLCLYSAQNILATVNNAPSAGTYEWKLNNSSLGISNTSLPINKTGNYSYHFSFNNGCASSATMQAFDVPKLKVADTSACLNGNTALIANLIPNANYFWGTPAINNGTNKFDITVTAPNPSFKVLVVDQNNCKDSTTAQISISPSPKFSLSGFDLCDGETKKLTATLDPLSNLPLSHSWTRNGVPLQTTKWEELGYNQGGSYTLTLGIGGCFETNSKTISVKSNPKINMPLVYKHCFETDPPLTINAQPFGKYTWLSEGNIIDTVQSIKVAPEKDTHYFLKVENIFGCKDSTRLLVRKVCAPRLFVPNVMTPESNDVNAKLRIFGANYTNFEITVFNRWGEVIFNSKDSDNAWAGDYLNAKMPIGNYQWQVSYEGDTEEYKGPYKKTGDVAVIR